MWGNLFSRLNATQKGMILVLVPVVVQFLFIALIYRVFTQAAEGFETIRRGKAAILRLHKNEINFARMIFILSDTSYIGNPEEYLRASSRIKVVYSADKAWTDLELKQFPELAPAIELAGRLGEQYDSLYRAGMDSAKKGSAAIEKFANEIGVNAGFNLYVDQRNLARMIIDIERKALESQPEQLARERTIVIAAFSLMLLTGFCVSGALALLFARDIVERLERIADKARLLAAGKPVPLKGEGSDEIAMLDAIISDAASTLSDVRAREAVVLDNAADVICSLDSKLRFTAVGEASSKIWRYSPDQLLGLSLLSVLAEDTIDRTHGAFSRLATASPDNSAATEGRVENRIRCSDGTYKDSIWTINWSAEKRAYFCVVHDVTELRSVEKLKQHFLSVASHDLRAPLAAVNLNVSLLMDGKKGDISDGAKKELSRVQSSVERLSALVGELLELEKLEAGRLKLDLTAVAASDVCEAAKELLFGLAQKSNIKLSGPSGEALLIAEEKRMVQLLTNLLSNAIKFSPPDSTVWIEIVKLEKFAEIRIKDEGPGISVADRVLIFDKFRQSETAETISQKGTGLGLAIVRALAESHGGEVGVESELGKGSTFFVRIPLFVDGEMGP